MEIAHSAGIIGSTLCLISGWLAGRTQTADFTWFHLPFSGLTWSVRVDPLSGVFLACLGIIGFCVSVYGVGYVRQYACKKSARLLVAGYLVFLASMQSVFVAGNVFTFLLSWECMSILSYLLVLYEHDRMEIQKAGFVYVAMTHVGTVFLTLAFLILAHFAGSLSFDRMTAVPMPAFAKDVVFLLVLVGFGTKAGLVPLHIWLPRAHPAAPSHVSALMSGVMIKTAVYGFLLVVFRLLGTGPAWWGEVVCVAGAITAVLGILHALAQIDQKRVLAYSSIENMGLIFMTLGASLLLVAQGATTASGLALLAALFHAFNHALYKSLLFLGAGSVLTATHCGNLNRLGGLIRTMPWTAVCTLAGSLAISAMPPWNGFTSEWMLFQSLCELAFASSSAAMQVVSALLMAVLAMTAALVATVFVRSFGTAFLALPRSAEAAAAREVSGWMRAGMVLLAGLCLVLGVTPAIALAVISPTVEELTGVRTAYGLAGLSWPIPHGAPVPISGLAVVLGFLCAFAVVSLMVAVSARGKRTLRSETWVCGGTLTPRMTYTASGYSKPIRVAFQWIFRPDRVLHQTSGSCHFPRGFSYRSRLHAFAEARLYRPTIVAAVRVSQAVRRIQNGQVQTYLTYLFVTLMAVLLLVK
ncbi:MAG: hydrogenase 4 subunit B [Alicyclobacillus sp.]|nr:hydrogenase 4 subunit B [Alicyclobacillus sp.]